MEERRSQHDVAINISDSEHIVGTGIVFNKESRQFTTEGGRKVVEIIRPEAVEGLLDDPDIRAYHSHQKHMPLGRNLKTMTLTADENGVHYDIDTSGELPSYTRDMQLSIRRGDVDTSSFGFIPGGKKEDTKISYRADGIFVREILRMAKITDMSPMGTMEAYPDTKASLRSVDDFASEMSKDDDSYIEDLITMYKDQI